MPATAALGLLSVLAFAQTGLAQTTPPLNFGNNYFVAGDYVVGGVGLRGLGDATGFATRTIKIPDANSVPATGVPLGAQIVAAILYWETVESSQTAFAGQQGFFRPVFPGGASSGYPITGVLLGNPNAPTSWSSGGCSGSAQGSKTMRGYRADVRAFLPVDSNGNVLANGSYEVRLADSGSNGAGAPLTLGATLVIIYRVISPNFPLNSVVIYDGAFAPANSASTMTQTMQGFYQAAASPIAKLTHIVGNGQTNKFESVSLNSVNLPSLYGSLPPFPGFYNGSWDNPTWSLPNPNPAVGNPVKANDASATTMVVPTASNSGCVNWGAVIFSTTVQSSKNDGLLDVWKQNQGYCDASVNGGVCSTTDPSFVALPGATLGQKDLFVQLDYMCSIVNNGVCVTTPGVSFLPSSQALTMMTNAFSPKGINLHLIPTNVIPEQTCTDNLSTSPPQLCPYPNQPGVVGWKGGFELLKSQPLNYPDESSCETATNPPCIRRFQHGKKDSYHYAIFGDTLGVPNWSFIGGTLISVVASGNTVTFTTSTAHGLVANDTVHGNGRVTVGYAITNLGLNGIYYVQSVLSPTSFTIQIANATNATYTEATDPNLSVASGQAGTGSGFSDVGGADSLITLGRWGADGQTVPVQAGTFMHELGHSVALTHGGFYYDTPGSYVPTLGANCKSNFQSVMNYLFQVDLLDNGVLDYSEQGLSTLNENSLPGGVTTTDGSALAFSTTKWYTPTQPGGIGTPATHRCDGTPLSQNDPLMLRVEGAANPIIPAWVSPQDINFNGNFDSSLRGYNDWANLDLRQIGATGSDIGSPGNPLFGAGNPLFGAGNPLFGAGNPLFGAGNPLFGAGNPLFGAGNPLFGAGVGNVEFTHVAANAAVRPPRNLTASVTPPQPTRFIQLNWTAPTFGQITSYNIYRAMNGTPVAPPYATVSGSPPPTSFLDKNVTCGPTFTYFVTAVLADGRESVPSNSVSLKDCAPPYTFIGFLSPLATAGDTSFSGAFSQGKARPIKWQLKDSSGNFVSNLNVNTLGEHFIPLPPSGVCPLPGAVPTGFDQPPLFSPTTGAEGSSTFRFDTTNNQFVFNWDTKPFSKGCYVIELDLDSGQVERTALQLN